MKQKTVARPRVEDSARRERRIAFYVTDQIRESIDRLVLAGTYRSRSDLAHEAVQLLLNDHKPLTKA